MNADTQTREDQVIERFVAGGEAGLKNGKNSPAAHAPLSGISPKHFETRTPAELHAEKPAPSLVSGLLRSAGIALLYGPSGVAKTFIVIHLALAIARGLRLFGRRTRQSPVVYVLLEGSFSDRAEAYCKDHSISLDELSNVHVVGAD